MKTCSFAGIAAGCALLWVTPLSGIIAGAILGMVGSLAGMVAGRFLAVAAGHTRTIEDFN